VALFSEVLRDITERSQSEVGLEQIHLAKRQKPNISASRACIAII